MAEESNDNNVRNINQKITDPTDGKIDYVDYFIDTTGNPTTIDWADIYRAKLQLPINEYDPEVVHDPPQQQPFIVKMRNTRSSDQEMFETRDIEDEKINAILIPVIRLNNVVLENNNIVAMSIAYTEFVPKLTLIVKDSVEKFNLPVRPGLNNLIQVVIMPNIDGKYKKVTLPFYIEDIDMDIYGEQVTYKCSLKHMPLIQELFTDEHIEYEGCAGGRCNIKPNNKPNMWELFHEVAHKSELGFAAMNGIEKYNDRTPRLNGSKSYKDLLEYNLKCGGKNYTMQYDGWVDLYGYLVVVDLFKIMNSDVESSNLAFYAETGPHLYNPMLKSEKLELVRRVLTNSNMTSAQTNCMIDEFYYTADLKEITDHGTLNTMYYFNPFGNKGQNTLTTSQIRIKEESPDGQFTEDYEISRYKGWAFVGCEEYNIAEQMEVRNAYMLKHNHGVGSLIVRLTIPNFALQRGTLITIIKISYDQRDKVRLMHQETNIYSDRDKGYTPDVPFVNDEYKDEITNNDMLLNDGVGVIDPLSSGIYYIRGMRFDYIAGNEKIQQYLYLTRKGPLMSLSNISTYDRVK